MHDQSFNPTPDGDFSLSMPRPVGYKEEVRISEAFRDYTRSEVESRSEDLKNKLVSFNDAYLNDPNFSLRQYCIELSLFPGTKLKHVTSCASPFLNLATIRNAESSLVNDLVDTLERTSALFLSKLDKEPADSYKIRIEAVVRFFSDTVTESFMSYEKEVADTVSTLQEGEHFLKEVSEPVVNPETGLTEQTFSGFFKLEVRVDPEAEFHSWFDRN